MPAYFILNWITGSILWSSFLYSLIQITIINLLMLSIFRKVFETPYQYMILTNILLCLFPLSELVHSNFVFVFYFLSNSYHLGSFVLTLLILNITIRQFRRPHCINLFWIGLLSLVGAMSDFLFIISATVPLVFASILLFKINIKAILLINMTSLIGIVIGLIFLNGLQNNHIIQLDGANSFLNYENIIPSLKEFRYQTYINLAKLDFSSLITLLSFGSLILLSRLSILIVFKKRDVVNNQKWMILFLTSSIYCLLGSPILAGNYTGSDTIRYNYHAYVLLIILLPYLTKYKWKKWRLKNDSFQYKHLLLAQGILTLIFLISTSINGKNYFKFHPKKVQIADDFSIETGLKTGAGTYWDAKLITMFSKQDVVILCTFENLIPYDHVANSSWFHKHPTDSLQRMEIEFNILEEDTRDLTLKNSFGDSLLNYWSSNGETYVIHPKYFYDLELKTTPVLNR